MTPDWSQLALLDFVVYRGHVQLMLTKRHNNSKRACLIAGM